MDQFSQQDTGSNTPSFLYRNIYATAKVAGITAIVSLAAALVGAIGVFSKPLPVMNAPAAEGFNEEEMQEIMKGGAYVSVIISLVISILIFYFLFRFSSLAKKAINTNDDKKLAIALKSLSGYFKVGGVIMIFIIVLFVLSLLGGVTGSALGG